MVNEKNPYAKYLSVEDREHIKVVEFMKYQYPDIICFHVPNEGKKSAFERYKHSLMGNLRGCPDFVVLHPKYSEVKKDGERPYKELVYHGLLIELKAHEHLRVVKKGLKQGNIVKSKGKLSKEQEEILEKINKVKYKAVCCFGFDEARKVIAEYLTCDHRHVGKHYSLEDGKHHCNKCDAVIESPSFGENKQ